MNKDLLNLRAVLAKLVGTPEDPKNGWHRLGATSNDHFRCEYCGGENIDCVLMAHTPECPVLEARAVLAQPVQPEEAK